MLPLPFKSWNVQGVGVALHGQATHRNARNPPWDTTTHLMLLDRAQIMVTKQSPYDNNFCASPHFLSGYLSGEPQFLQNKMSGAVTLTIEMSPTDSKNRQTNKTLASHLPS